MSTSHWCQIALVSSIAAAALGGCGSSSSTATTSTATTPAASSTFYNFALLVATNSAPQLSASQTKVAAQCFQKRFLAAGFKTQGDLEKASNGEKERGITVKCIVTAEGH
jgi:hypothetical protein